MFARISENIVSTLWRVRLGNGWTSGNWQPILEISAMDNCFINRYLARIVKQLFHGTWFSQELPPGIPRVLLRKLCGRKSCLRKNSVSSLDLLWGWVVQAFTRRRFCPKIIDYVPCAILQGTWESALKVLWPLTRPLGFLRELLWQKCDCESLNLGSNAIYDSLYDLQIERWWTVRKKATWKASS